MKKGFIFVETMVCIAFLSTVLLSVYASFTTVLDNAKTRLLYDDPIYLYRTYYILNYLEENGLTEYISEKFSSQNNNTSYISEFGCSSAGVVGDYETGTVSERHFCEKILQGGDWNVNHVFIMPYNINKVVNCVNNDDIKSGEAVNCRRNTALKNLSVQAVNYLYSLDGYTGSPDEDDILGLSDTQEKVDPSKQIYRIVIEFKVADKSETYTYYDYCLNNNKTCSEWNPESNKNTYTVTNYKYYYTSLEIPNGYNQIEENGFDLKIKYDGNGATGWCSTSPIIVEQNGYAYNKETRSEYVIHQKGQYLQSTKGLSDYNNTSYICFERDNYTALYHKEWNTKPDGTGVTFDQFDHNYKADDIADAIGCDLSKQPCTAVLYVNWVPRQEYSISYQLDGGTNNASNPDKYYNDQKVTIREASKTNYTFMGWTGTGIAPKTYLKTISITKEAGNKEYTAHWCESCANDKCVVKMSEDGICNYSCDSRYICKGNCGTKNPTCEPAHYTNGTNSFTTLEEAIAGTPSGGTITLIDDYSDTSPAIFENKYYTLNLNGHTLTRPDKRVFVKSGNLTITNGRLISNTLQTIQIGSVSENKSGTLQIINNSGKTTIENTWTGSNNNKAVVEVLKGQVLLLGNSEIIYSPTSSSSAARGVIVGENGKFAMNSNSKIRVNADGTNGGIGVINKGEFTFNDGIIYVSKGTGVDNQNKFDMMGGEIVVNRLLDNTCGVCNRSSGDNRGVNLKNGSKITINNSSTNSKGAIAGLVNEGCISISQNFRFKCPTTGGCIVIPRGKMYAFARNRDKLINQIIEPRPSNPIIESAGNIYYNYSRLCF